MDELTSQYPPLPADDLKRNLTLAQIDEDKLFLTLVWSETPTPSPSQERKQREDSA
jgi:hypothetical protein